MLSRFPPIVREYMQVNEIPASEIENFRAAMSEFGYSTVVFCDGLFLDGTAVFWVIKQEVPA